eukprot:Polyplicarium_translucidae@DN690_c0_g1_i1.p1
MDASPSHEVSKSQLKKRLKRARATEKWAARKASRKVNRAASGSNGPALPSALPPASPPTPSMSPAEVSRSERFRREFRARVGSRSGSSIVVDCDFEELQTDREITSLGQQLMQCYGANRRAASPFPLIFCGLGQRIGGQLDAISGSATWEALLRSRHVLCSSDLIAEIDRSFDQRTGRARFVYLTPDADNVLTDMEADTAFVLGGVVDRNRHKGLTLHKARKLGLETSRLPIREVLAEHGQKLAASVVLTVNQIHAILLRFAESVDWYAAIISVLPPRKVVKTNEAEIGQRSVEDPDGHK